MREVRWRKEAEIGEVEEGKRHWREGREGKVRTEAESSDMAMVAGEEEEEQLDEDKEGEIEDGGDVKAFVSGLRFWLGSRLEEDWVWRGAEVSRGKNLGREKGIEGKGKRFDLKEGEEKERERLKQRRAQSRWFYKRSERLISNN